MVEDEDLPNGPTDDIVASMSYNRKYNEGVEALIARKDTGMSFRAMRLAGVAMNPEARRIVNESLSGVWNESTIRSGASEPDWSRREVIIGGGITAATYAASRVRMGYKKPIVLEQGPGEAVGGTFAWSLDPVFYLNSRNRPGKVALPGEGAALNYIPGALIQPSDLSNAEYQTNADLAWVIRVALGQFADVYPNVEVRTASPSYNEIEFSYKGNPVRLKSAGRIIDARGLGKPRDDFDGKNVLTFQKFMARMGGMFPLRGMDRVAVIGGGDSGKTAVEALLGIGPQSKSLASLDVVGKIDWYAPHLPGNKQGWLQRIRGRYLRIADFFKTGRLRVLEESGIPEPVLDGAMVNGRSYDMVVVCTGFSFRDIYGGYSRNDFGWTGDNTTTGRQYREMLIAGPASEVILSDGEYAAGIANFGNAVGIFRYANRTSALAVSQPDL